MTVYVPEEFTSDEEDILRRYFTNLDGPVFALVNLPEVVKGALFARYSRSPKSLRRLFLDEFVGDLDVSGDVSIDATVGLERAEELYEKVFFEYGDDSVAQLGGVHLACEQASNILTKVLEWGRLMSYLEQKSNPLPEYMLEILRQVATGSSYKSVLQSQMSFYQEKYVKSAQRIIRSLLFDSITDYNQLRQWYDNIGGYQMDLQIVNTWIAEGAFDVALDFAEALPAMHQLEGDQLAAHEEYMSLLEMSVDLEQQNRNIRQLTAQELAMISTLAQTASPHAKAKPGQCLNMPTVSIILNALMYPKRLSLNQLNPFLLTSWPKLLVCLSRLNQIRQLIGHSLHGNCQPMM